MTTLPWDRTNLCPSKVSVPKIIANNTSGGVGFGGSEQIIGNTPPRWGIKFSDIALNRPAKILAWNALAGLLNGRLVPVLIPVFDRNRAPSPAVTASMSGAASAGSVAVNIKVLSGGGAISPGMHFSVAERLYRLLTMDAGTPGSGYIVFACTITPPVREAIPDTTALEFGDPWFRVRLATDDEMSDVDLDVFKYGSVTVNFLEDA